MRKFWIAPLCLCLALTGCGAKQEAEPPQMQESSFELMPIAPEREETHANYVEDARNLLASAQDSRAKLRAAAEGNARAEEIAAGADERCGQRLDELAGADLDAMEDGELEQLMLELSNILTELREARDAVAALG